MEKIKLVCRTTEEEIWVPKGLVDIINDVYMSHTHDLVVKDTFLKMKNEIIDKVKKTFLVSLPLNKIVVTYDSSIHQGVIEIKHDWITSNLNTDSPVKYSGLTAVP